MTPLDITASSFSIAFFVNCFSFLTKKYEKRQEIQERQYPNIIKVTNMESWDKYKIKEKYPYFLSHSISSKYINFIFPSAIYSSYDYLIYVLIDNLREKMSKKFNNYNFTILIEMPECVCRNDNVMIIKLDIVTDDKKYFPYAANILSEYYENGLTRFHNSGSKHSYKKFLMSHSKYITGNTVKDNMAVFMVDRFLGEIRNKINN